MLDKNFNPKNCETRLYELWEKKNAFKPNKQNDEPYTIVIPPPNITGNLHIGHALNNVVQDILIRYARLCGKKTLWQPGTDHASIATQMVVERKLKNENQPSRHQLGREPFLEKIWQWKKESGGAITHQLKRLGSSCDWSRERFTMDEGLSHAVLKTFVQLYNEGLIYRDKRLVNWDPVMETAISDLETIPTEVEGHLWYFRYPLQDGSAEIPIATTRPETMLGDTAIAVHPDDERYKAYIGKYAIQPLTQNKLLIVADTYADPEQGTGAVKITPAHDFNDFEVGTRHNLPLINIMTLQGAMNENTPEAYRGLDRYVARDAVVENMKKLGFFDKKEPHLHTVPYGDRGGVPIEPLLTDQWFADAKTLAQPAIEAVKNERIKFVPQNWTRTYYNWMENIQPWCISRQLWWGHRIPAWYGDDGKIFVAMNETEAYEIAKKHYNKDNIKLKRDEDVLDTWFSSALWPFSTLGWPEKNELLATHYPTDVLVTAFDILFFWVARMIMFGLHFMKTEPFHTVYVHALVRDSKGQKMSKSKGNVIDPLNVIDEYGCDAMRFALASLAAPGKDIKLSTDKVAAMRNFITKIWNAARFCEMQNCTVPKNFNEQRYFNNHKLHHGNLWIIAKLLQCEADLKKAIESYRFHDASAVLYHFIWRDFCDSFLELSKPALNGDDENLKKETQITAAWTLKRMLLLLHPIAPFISEELWQKFYKDEGLLINAKWQNLDITPADDSLKRIEWALKVITNIRSARARLNIAASLNLPLKIVNLDDAKKLWLDDLKVMLKTMARLSDITLEEKYNDPAIRIPIEEAIFTIPATDVFDIAAEKKRLQDSIAKQQEEIDKLNKKLNNKEFTAKAPEKIIAQVQQKHIAAEEILQSLRSAENMLEI